MPVLRAVGRAILGTFAGMCIGLFPGTLIVAFIVHAVLRLGSPSQERVNLYFAVSAIAGAILGAILGLTIRERELSSGARQSPSGANRKLFHPLGLLIGLACGTIFGATFSTLFVYSPHPADAHAALVVTCIAAILGGVGGGFIGPTSWMMIGGALVGWIIVGIGFVLGYHHIKGMIYGAFFGAPLGALLGFFHGLRQEESAKRSKPRAAQPSSAASVWDREIDA
jgi:MFS family permease